MFYRPWQTVRPDPARSAALSAALGMPRLVCDVMCARGLDTPEAARAVCGGGDALSDPMLLSGMEAAVARIHRAIDDGERIAVFGDYDVDGVTATALLYTYLDSAGADVYYKLPSRDDDGYGLSETAVDLMAAKGVSLIVTVDNGVSANAAIAHAKEQGVDVVVTDQGVAVNPVRTDLAKSLADAGLPLRSLEELQRMAERIVGAPDPIPFADKVVGVVAYRDNSVIDVVRAVKKS